MSATHTFFLVSCVSKKHSRPLPARSLYCSDWFNKARQYVERQRYPSFILSAKYGLVRPDEIISPYDVTLNNMNNAERFAWAEGVSVQLRRLCHSGDTVVFLAG